MSIQVMYVGGRSSVTVSLHHSLCLVFPIRLAVCRVSVYLVGM